MNQDSRLEIAVQPLDKALWPAGGARTAEEYVREGHTLFDGSVSWPVMVLREDALETNLAALAAFCARHGLQNHCTTAEKEKLYQ